MCETVAVRASDSDSVNDHCSGVFESVSDFVCVSRTEMVSDIDREGFPVCDLVTVGV